MEKVVAFISLQYRYSLRNNMEIAKPTCHIQKVKIVTNPLFFINLCTFTMLRPRVYKISQCGILGITVTLIETTLISRTSR